MSFQLQMEQMPGYLAARFIGVGVPGEASEQFESIAEYCKRTKNHKILVDATAYDLDVKPSTVDIFRFGERLQTFSRHGIKVAFICRPEQLDPGKFGLLVARNRGVCVDAFTDLCAAEEWLLR
jgi:hypothetical protein